MDDLSPPDGGGVPFSRRSASPVSPTPPAPIRTIPPRTTSPALSIEQDSQGTGRLEAGQLGSRTNGTSNHRALSHGDGSTFLHVPPRRPSQPAQGFPARGNLDFRALALVVRKMHCRPHFFPLVPPSPSAASGARSVESFLWFLGHSATMTEERLTDVLRRFLQLAASDRADLDAPAVRSHLPPLPLLPSPLSVPLPLLTPTFARTRAPLLSSSTAFPLPSRHALLVAHPPPLP